MHLCYLIHGLYGNQSHMDTMKSILDETLPSEEFIVYSSCHNEGFKTFDGVRLGSYRVYHELLEFLDDHPEVTHISVVGYSLGGLYARHMLGLMEDTGFFDRIVPVNFTTFATPHMGTTLWTTGFKTKILNGMARLFLGPSGVDLMSRGPPSLLDRLVEPDSKYVTGLRRFENLYLFCNAIGDRTVRFWTSFITNKTPFKKSHKYECDLVFYTYNKDPFGPVFVDLDRTKYKDVPDQPDPPKKTPVWERLIHILTRPIYLLVGPIFLVMLTMSVVSWLKLPFLLPYYKKKIYNHAKSTAHPSSSEEETVLLDLNEEAHMIVEDLPPDEDSSLVSSVRTSTAPRPCKSGKFLEASKYEIDFPTPFRHRMSVLNSLPWQKYVVYSNHYRTHASIIDRLKEGPSKGTEDLHFFADLLSGKKVN